MPLHSDWYDIVGLSVIGPPPLGEIHLPWQRGLHVVYGRNGAGKTRLLEAISSLSPRVEALEGGTAFVHLVYDSDAAFRPDAENHLPHELLAWDLCDSALERYFEGVAFERDSIDQGTLDFLQFDWRDTTLGEVVRTVARVPGMVLDHDSLILDETLSANALSISSGGSVWLSAPVGSDTPRIREALASGNDELAGRSRAYPGEWQPIWAVSSIRNRLVYARSSEWLPVLPVPLLQIGRIRQFDGALTVLGRAADDPEVETNDLMADLLFGEGPEALTSAGSLFDIPEETLRIIDNMSSDATVIVSEVLQDAPTLRLELLEPREWFKGRVVAWKATDSYSASWIPLAHLSGAQRKWAAFSVDLVNAWLRGEDAGGGHRILLVDEPEEALHPTAINYLMQDLEATAQDLNGPTILASHSPQVISWPGIHHHHIARDPEGRATVRALDLSAEPDLASKASSLGLRPVDLMQTYRVFLVVEGQHDSAVLETVFPGAWEANRIRILHMRGSRHVLDIAGSEILRDASDAVVMVLLDNLSAFVIEGINAAMNLAKDGDHNKADRMLAELETKVGRGEKPAVELARKAVKIARTFMDRPYQVSVLGLSKGDIVEYLDPRAFGLTSDWVSLRKQHAAEAREVDFIALLA